MTNYYYDLPDDIRNEIILANIANVIVIAARKFINRNIKRKKMLKELVNNIEEVGIYTQNIIYRAKEYNVMSVDVAKYLELLAKNITGRETKYSVEESEFWKEVLNRTIRGIYADEYTGGPGGQYWEKSLDAFTIIYNKFKKYDVNFTLDANEEEMIQKIY